MEFDFLFLQVAACPDCLWKVILMFLLALLLAAAQFKLGVWFYLGLIGAAALFVYQWQLTRGRTPEGCFKAFLNNHRVGAVVFAGIVLHYLFAAV